jgi:hypothetical protein
MQRERYNQWISMKQSISEIQNSLIQNEKPPLLY